MKYHSFKSNGQMNTGVSVMLYTPKGVQYSRLYAYMLKDNESIHDETY